MAKRKAAIKRKKGRERICGFSWKTSNGNYQALYENDFDSRKQFINERASFKRNGIRIKDCKTRKPVGRK